MAARQGDPMRLWKNRPKLFCRKISHVVIVEKTAPTFSRLLIVCFFLKKSYLPVGENSHNLVTLLPAQFWHKCTEWSKYCTYPERGLESKGILEQISLSSFKNSTYMIMTFRRFLYFFYAIRNRISFWDFFRKFFIVLQHMLKTEWLTASMSLHTRETWETVSENQQFLKLHLKVKFSAPGRCHYF
jgi:hypothetical protein